MNVVYAACFNVGGIIVNIAMLTVLMLLIFRGGIKLSSCGHSLFCGSVGDEGISRL